MLWCTYRLSKNSSGTKSCLRIGREAVEFNPDEYQKFKYHRYVQKSYVPTPLRASITTWEQTQTFLIKNLTVVSSFTTWRNSIFLKSMLIKSWDKNLNHKFPCSSSPYFQSRTNRVCEFYSLNKLTFSKWWATYILVCINDLTTSMYTLWNKMSFNNWISICISHVQAM